MIIRSYLCRDCGIEFEVTCESNSGDPDCPNCSKVLQWKPERFAITGIKSKALDTVQSIMEQQYGYTDFKDKVDMGETVVKAPRPMQGAEADAIGQQVSQYAEQTLGTPLTPIQKKMASTFWDGGQAAVSQIPVASLLAGAKANHAMNKSQGLDAMQILSEEGRAGKLRQKIDVVARAKM
jgi:DNA-directed RNA polymerase subunit RPC12/RpoP